MAASTGFGAGLGFAVGAEVASKIVSEPDANCAASDVRAVLRNVAGSGADIMAFVTVARGWQVGGAAVARWCKVAALTGAADRCSSQQQPTRGRRPPLPFQLGETWPVFKPASAAVPLVAAQGKKV